MLVGLGLGLLFTGMLILNGWLAYGMGVAKANLDLLQEMGPYFDTSKPATSERAVVGEALLRVAMALHEKHPPRFRDYIWPRRKKLAA